MNWKPSVYEYWIRVIYSHPPLTFVLPAEEWHDLSFHPLKFRIIAILSTESLLYVHLQPLSPSQYPLTILHCYLLNIFSIFSLECRSNLFFYNLRWKEVMFGTEGLRFVDTNLTQKSTVRERIYDTYIYALCYRGETIPLVI